MLSLLSPNENVVGTPLLPTFVWATTDAPTTFNLQISTTADFTSLVLDVATTQTTYTLIQGTDPSLASATTYFWRVGQTMSGNTEYSPPRVFVSGLATPNILSAGNNNAAIAGGSAIVTWNTPSNNGVTGFVVANSQTSGAKENEVSLPATQSLLTANGLPNNANRYFAVKATGSVTYDEIQVWTDNSIEAIITEDGELVNLPSSDSVIV